MKDVQHRKEDAMTLPTADLISEVLRLDEEATRGPWSTFVDDTGGEFSGWPYAEEKLARANEALCLVIGLAEEGVRSLRRSPSSHQEHIREDEETLARVRAIIAALKEPVT